MSKAIRCDRCDDIVEKNGVYAIVTFAPYENEHERVGSTTRDLCEACARQVSNVLLADARRRNA